MSSDSPEKIVVQCECGVQLRLDVKYQGKKIKCPKCQGVVAVPAAASAPAPAAPTKQPKRSPAATQRSTSTSQPPAQPKSAPAGGRPARSETRRSGKAAAGSAAPMPGERQMINRAPTTADDDQFSKDTVTGFHKAPQIDRPPQREQPGRAGAGGAVAAGGAGGIRRGNTARRTAGGGGGGGGTARRAAGRAPAGGGGGNQPNMQLIIGISGGALSLIVVLAILLMGGGSDSDSDEQAAEVNGDSGRNGSAPDEPREPAIDRFQDSWRTATDVRQRKHVLKQFAPERDGDAALSSEWDRRFRTVRGEIYAEYTDSSVGIRTRIDGLMRAAKWAEELGESEFAKGFAEQVVDLEPDHAEAREILGFKLWEFPRTELVERARMRTSRLDEFTQYDRVWMSPNRWQDVQSRFDAAISEIREMFAEWEADPFLERADQMKSSILNDRILREYSDRFELRTIRPFVIIFGTEGGEGDLWLEERYEDFREVLEPFWEMWTNLCREYGLESKKRDCTLEQPQPFAYLSMATEEGFREYLSETGDDNLPPGVRAFYRPNNELVYFWEGDGDLEVQTVLHEALHQIMERYSPGHESMFGYRNAAFVEGAAEYYSGWDRGGPGGTVRFKRWTLAGRAQSMEMIRNWFGNDEGVLRWNITDDDWVLYQVPALISLSLNLARAYAPGVIGEDLQRSNTYRRNIGAIILAAQNAFPLLYAYAWAWVYFLNEYYPNEWERYMHGLMMEGKADVEAFLDAFNIRYSRSEFPDISRLIGRNFFDSWNDTDRRRMIEDRFWERTEWLKEHPRIIEINEQYVDFLSRQLDRGIQADETHGSDPFGNDSEQQRMRLPWPDEANENNHKPRQPDFEAPPRHYDRMRLPWPETSRR